MERAGHWLPPGAWHACVGEPTFTPGESIWVCVDVGGDRSATAVVWLNTNHHVGVWIGHGEEAVLEAVELLRELTERYSVAEVVFDPWRFGQAAVELEREGLTVVKFPQTDQRMIPASSRLHAAIVSGRIVLPDHDELRQHAANAIARHSRRGWRIDKASRSDKIDAIIALCMALARLEDRPERVRLIGSL